MEAYSEEVEIGKKKVNITVEFPYTADTNEKEGLEFMLKEIYLDKIRNKIQKEKSEINFQGGKEA